jgi:hypothetical protein
MASDSVVVYWAPAAFDAETESWNLLYPEPELVRTKLQTLHTEIKRNMFVCPSIKDYLNNLFCLKSAVDDSFRISSEFLAARCHLPETEDVPCNPSSIVSLFKARATSITGYANVNYNLGWLFFCEEPLTMRFLPPFLPTSSPVKGALLATGELDIGKWYRPLMLDYHIPLDSTEFNIFEGDELAYLKFETNKKVILKRYVLTKTLFNYSSEMANSSLRYSKFKPLSSRYEMAKNSGMQKLILKEIKNNLID